MAKKVNKIDYTDVPETLVDHPFYGLELDDEQIKFRDTVWKREKNLFFINSIAGSGKTLISVAIGLLMVKYGLMDKMVYVTFAGNNEKELGYLKGTYIDKMMPYLEPLFDALTTLGEDYLQICSLEEFDKYGEKIVYPTTSTYMRGVNLQKSFVICDESENATLDTLAKVISRCNDDCVCCVIGHTGQIDLEDKRKSGFSACIDFNKKYNPEMCDVFNFKTNHRGWISEFADLMLTEYDYPTYGFIYMTKNLINGKLYIGQHRRTMNPKDINDNWYLGSGVVLKKAIVKYGIDNFKRTIIYECNSQDELNYMEEIFTEFYNAVGDDNFYNLVRGGGGTSGKKFTEEEKEHMRKPHKPMDEETKKRWVEAHKREMSEEEKEKRRQTAIRKLTGFVHSEQSKKNMSDGHKRSKTMYKDGIYKNIVPKLQELYLADGWIFKSHPRPSQRVKCIDIINNETSYYTNVKDASLKLNIPESSIRGGIQHNRITRNQYRFSYSNIADELK